MSASGPETSPALPGGTGVDRQLQAHLGSVRRGFEKGRLTPVLGAGASLFGRMGATQKWEGAPSAGELAARLAREFDVPEDLVDSGELLMVSQWVTAMADGLGPLYEELHDVFDRDFLATPLHDFLARIPGRLRERELLREPPLLITTNYDDLLERSLEAAGEPYDLVVYMAAGEYQGRFCYIGPDGKLEPIREPQKYEGANPSQRTVVVKLHGFVNRHDRDQDSYVITEDHYIEYLGNTDLDLLLPVHVVERLKNCNLLFLGYSLRDWNLRAILYQLKKEAKPHAWWAVLLNCDELERKSWENRDVSIIDMALEDYLVLLRSTFETYLSERQ